MAKESGIENTTTKKSKKKYSNDNNDIVDTIIRNWKIIKFSHSHRYTKYYVCQCVICNTEQLVTRATLLCKQNKKCKLCQTKVRKSQIASLNPNWKGHNSITGEMFCNLKNKAKVRNIEFHITKEYLYELFIKQNRKCSLTNNEIFLPPPKYRNNGTASLDRIDSSKGYIEGNVQWVHKDINIMKNIFSEEKLIEYCKQIYLHSLEKMVNNGER